MNSEKRNALAATRAEQYAPKPTGGSLMAGISGAVLALVGDMAGSAFYGWRLLDHMLIAALISAAGFVVGFVGYKRVARLNRRARQVERAQIDIDQDR